MSKLLVESRVLTEADLIALEQYCSVYSTFVKTSHSVETDGIILESDSGVRKNPAAGVKMEASRELRSLSAMLGLDPSSRTRVSANAPPAEQSPWAKFKLDSALISSHKS